MAKTVSWWRLARACVCLLLPIGHEAVANTQCPALNAEVSRIVIVGDEFAEPAATCTRCVGITGGEGCFDMFHHQRNGFQIRNFLDPNVSYATLSPTTPGFLIMAMSNGDGVELDLWCNGPGCGPIDKLDASFPSNARYVQCNAATGAGDCTIGFSYTNFQGGRVEAWKFLILNNTSVIPPFTVSGGGFDNRAVFRN